MTNIGIQWVKHQEEQRHNLEREKILQLEHEEKRRHNVADESYRLASLDEDILRNAREYAFRYADMEQRDTHFKQDLGQKDTHFGMTYSQRDDQFEKSHKLAEERLELDETVAMIKLALDQAIHDEQVAARKVGNEIRWAELEELKRKTDLDYIIRDAANEINERRNIDQLILGLDRNKIESDKVEQYGFLERQRIGIEGDKLDFAEHKQAQENVRNWVLGVMNGMINVHGNVTRMVSSIIG